MKGTRHSEEQIIVIVVLSPLLDFSPSLLGHCHIGRSSTKGDTVKVG
jgi:hypothetical protein